MAKADIEVRVTVEGYPQETLSIAPPRVGETIEIRCPAKYGWANCLGADLPAGASWWAAIVAGTDGRGVAFVDTKQACCGEHSHGGYGPEQHGTWWRRPEVESELTGIDTLPAGTWSNGPASTLTYEGVTAAMEELRAKVRGEPIAQPAPVLEGKAEIGASITATHCAACGSDLRSRLETRPYCKACNMLFGNATVLPIEAPEPEAMQAWRHVADGRVYLSDRRYRADQERVWGVFVDVAKWVDGGGARDPIAHPLRSEAIRLWREAWVKRERERIEAYQIERFWSWDAIVRDVTGMSAEDFRRSLEPEAIESDRAAAKACYWGAGLRTESGESIAGTPGLSEPIKVSGWWTGGVARVNIAPFSEDDQRRVREALDGLKREAFAGTFAPTYINEAWLKEKACVATPPRNGKRAVMEALEKLGADGVQLEPDAPRVPQPGDPIEVRPEGEDEWLPAKVVANPQPDQLSAYCGERGYIIGMLKNDPCDPWWSWPSEVKA